jgi:hypothetical protein
MPTVMGQNGVDMAVLLVLLIPLLLMVFALLMERVEHRLQMRTMSEHDVEEFLEMAKPDEVDTFIKEGWSGALASFRGRRTTRDRRGSGIPMPPGPGSTAVGPPIDTSAGPFVGGPAPTGARHEGPGPTA